MSLGISYVTATIANGASLSDAVHLQGGRLFAIMMPADWTAADLTFQASTNNTLFHNIYDADDAEVNVAAGEDRYIILEPQRWLGVQQIKVRSGTAGSPVNQGAARSIILVCAV